MVMVLLNPLRRWWQSAFGAQAAFGAQSAFVTSTGRASFEPRVPMSALGPAIRSALAASSRASLRPSLRPLLRPAPRPALHRGGPMGALVGRPVTPFRSRTGSAVQPAQQAARRFWMTLDPQDQRHGAIGGSFAEVCAALEKLAALEERRL